MKVKIVTLLMAVFTIFSSVFLYGCDNRTDKGSKGKLPDSTLAVCDNYVIKRTDGAVFIAFNDIGFSSVEGSSSVATLRFDSMESLVNSIKNDTFEDWQRDVIKQNFPCNENGVLVFDISHCYDAVFPSDFKTGNVFWKGERYSFEATGTNDKMAYIYCLTADSFNSKLKDDYTDYFNNQNIELIESKTDNTKGTEEYYYKTSTGEFKKIRFKLKDGSIVDETYWIKTSFSDIPISDSIPYNITVYKTKGDANFVINIFYPDKAYDEDYLNKFDIKEFKS